MSRARDTADQINRVNSSAADATAITVDSSENVLVGTTSSDQSIAGHGFKPDGFAYHTRDGGAMLRLNRKTSDGDLLQIQKDGTTVGSIGTIGSDIVIGSGNTGLRFYEADNSILPSSAAGQASNGTLDIGDGSFRWKDLYLSGGVYLGGTGSANKLDDYESGAWTPSVGGNATYSIQSGSYIKVGKIVFIYGEMRITSIGTGTVNFLSGLPFNGNAEHTINISKLVNSSTSVYWANLRTSGASLYLAYQNALDGTWTNNPSFLTSSTEIQFSGTYETDS